MHKRVGACCFARRKISFNDQLCNEGSGLRIGAGCYRKSGTTTACDIRVEFAIDGDAASWIKAQLNHFFEAAAKNMRSEAAQGRVLPDELRQSVDRAMDKSLAEVRRDLQIDLDLALVTKAHATPMVDEALREPLGSGRFCEPPRDVPSEVGKTQRR